MARRRRAEPAGIVVKAFAAEEIERGIGKLSRRIDDVRQLQEGEIRFDDAAKTNVERDIRETVRDVFGPQSPEFDDHEHHRIWHGGYGMYDTDAGLQEKFGAGIPQTITMLEGLVGRLEEKREDLGLDPRVRAHAQIQGMELHPRISAVSRELFDDGHYAIAVFEASKALINFVKERSMRDDLDGAPLMRTVFSRNNPVLAFNDLSDQSDQDEQEGLMHLFEGAVLAIRNPRGHDFRVDTPESALEYLSFLSLLANRLDQTIRR